MAFVFRLLETNDDNDVQDLLICDQPYHSDAVQSNPLHVRDSILNSNAVRHTGVGWAAGPVAVDFRHPLNIRCTTGLY